jgi:tight adherence protein C
MFFVALVIFLATVCILMVLVHATGPETVDVGRRLSRTLQPAGSDQAENVSAKGVHRAENVFVSIGQLLPPPKGKKASQDQVLLIRAGYRGKNVLVAIGGVRILGCALLLFITFWTGLSSINPIAIPLLAGLAGWFAPELWLLNRVKHRQKLIRLALPDAMDLLVICVEVGLGLDQSLLKVAEEIELAHPELSDELNIVNLEMRVGKVRIDALRDLAQRTGLDDIKALVGILVQTDRFGTSLVQALRTYSDELRTKRRQRAEEMSSKVSVKMVPALVFFIFPALMVVILGPAVLMIAHTLLPTLK